MTRHQFGGDPGTPRPTSFPGGRTWLEAVTDPPEAFVPATDGANSPGTPGYRRIGWPRDAAQLFGDTPGRVPYLRPALEAALAGETPGEFALRLLDSATAETRGEPRPAYARVYRTGQDPEDPELGPCWHWRCEACGMQGNGCAHAVLHGVGTWRATMCGGFHHVHTEHPRKPDPQGEHPHDTLAHRRRCDWSPPHDAQLRLATLVLCGATGYPRGDRAREMAREVLALAGRRTP